MVYGDLLDVQCMHNSCTTHTLSKRVRIESLMPGRGPMRMPEARPPRLSQPLQHVARFPVRRRFLVTGCFGGCFRSSHIGLPRSRVTHSGRKDIAFDDPVSATRKIRKMSFGCVLLLRHRRRESCRTKIFCKARSEPEDSVSKQETFRWPQMTIRPAQGGCSHLPLGRRRLVRRLVLR